MRRVFVIFILFTFSGCIISKRAKDRSVIKYARNNQEYIQKIVAFSLEATLDKKIKGFEVSEIQDSEMRDKTKRLGTFINITYQKSNYPQEVPDSFVTFSSSSLLGLIEVIYDFASQERNFPNDVSSKSNYYFVKVTNRIYYKRSYRPLMVH